MTSEAEKLSSHLALLRTEYVKLQQKCTKLERDLAVVSAQVVKCGHWKIISHFMTGG